MSSQPLAEKVDKWLSSQGYPLEFSTAAIFHGAGFAVRQGLHVEDSDAIREVDVVASLDLRAGKILIRAEFVVECKWSADKPWIVFCSRHSRIAKSACIAQLLGSKAARTALWARAGDEAIHSLGIFETPEVPGFGGRQAFSDNRDMVFDALKSVVSLAHARAGWYDGGAHSPAEHLDLAVIVVPIIVLKGSLFIARFDENLEKMVVEEVSSARIHWRGSDKRRLITTIDIVTENQLRLFASQKRQDVDVLLPVLSESVQALKSCFLSRKLYDWPVTSGPRGFLGRPSLLDEMYREISEKRP